MRGKFRNYTPQELQDLLDTSNSYADVLKKIDLKPAGGNYNTLRKLIKTYKLDTNQIDNNRSCMYSNNMNELRIRRTYITSDILEGKHEGYQSYSLLKRLIKEGYKEPKCEKCGITDWLGKPISFELHHRDGNHSNNKLDNLQILCPNCHSQTDNYRGRKKKKTSKIPNPKKMLPKCRVNKQKHKKKDKVKKERKVFVPPISRADLKYKIRHQSFLSIAGEYDVSDNAIRKWCDKYHLPRKKTVIQTYSDEEWEQI